MDFAKIKTILIALLLCVNVFLCIVFLAEGYNKNTISAQTVTNTVDALALNNVAIETDIIPRRKPQFKIATITLESDFAQKTGQALFPLGFTIQHEDSDSIWIDSDNGNFKLLAKSELVFEKNAEGTIQMTKDYAQQCITDFFKAMQVKKSGYEIISNIETDADSRKVTVIQKIDGKNVFDAVLTAEIDKDGNQHIVGRWVFGRLTSTLDTSGSDVLNLLFDFAKYVEGSKGSGTVTKLSNGFMYLPGGNSTLGKARLFPAWYIETSDGNQYYYDAVMGDFVRLTSTYS